MNTSSSVFRMIRHCLFGFLSIAALSCAAQAQSGTYYFGWNGFATDGNVDPGETGAWNVASNWHRINPAPAGISDVVPGSTTGGSLAYVNGNRTVIASGAGDVFNLSTMQAGGTVNTSGTEGSDGPGTILIQDGAKITVSGSAHAGYYTDGHISVTGTDSLLEAAEMEINHQHETRTSSLTVGDGGTVRVLGDLTTSYFFGQSIINLNAGGTLELGGGTDGIMFTGNTANNWSTLNFNFSGGTLKIINNDFTTSIGTNMGGNRDHVAFHTKAINGTLTDSTISTFDTNGQNAYWAGRFQGSGDLVKAGAGTLTLAGAGTNTGATTINEGTLLANNTTGSATGTGGVTVNGGKFGGTGSVSGAVTVNSGGTASPGASVESLSTGALTLNNNSTFEFELDSSAALASAADLWVANGNLTLSGTVILTIDDLASSPAPFAPETTTFSLINYSGTWNDGLFTYNGNELSNGEIFAAGLNLWQISYNDSEGGLNFTGDYIGGSDSFVNITAVIPEPSTFVMLISVLGLALVDRRRSRA